MKIEFELAVILIKDESIPGCIVSWCPQLNLMSQGSSAQESIAMCIDACLLIAREDLSAHNFSSGKSKRVTHPLRRSWVPNPEDELEPYEQAWIEWNDEALWSNTIGIKPDEFEQGPEEIGFTDVRIEGGTLGGILFLSMESYRFHGSYGFNVRVPARGFQIEFEETFTRRKSFTERASSFKGENVEIKLRERIIQELNKDQSGFGHNGQKIEIKNVRVSSEGPQRARKKFW